MPEAMSVAREFVRLSLSGEEPDPLTSLRLQKLLYYAQGWSMPVRGGCLFEDRIEAWRCGPVVAGLYHSLPFRNRQTIGDESALASHEPSDDDRAFVAAVWESYKDCSANRLVTMTHAEPPWDDAWKRRAGDKGGEEITWDAMNDFFSSAGMPAPLAALKSRLDEEDGLADERIAAGRAERELFLTRCLA